ncbi:O-antigen ligase family protein [Paeniglutamicibacter gangotriensis]|uniref:O-antigen ligase family protein n=1 Tax=Paeniglutamicibacter gangotriensis TaxID=254787 RepID=UPI0013778512|nr:O-antigen ligase family protein [Paeniglutamicibacter gangotriensis]
MTANKPLLTLIIVIAVITPIAVANPSATMMVFLGIAGIALLYFLGDWWRRVWVMTLIALMAGVSHIEAIASYGSLAKIAALGVLAVTTWLTTRRIRPVKPKSIHKAILRALAFTAVFAAVSTVWSESKMETAMQAVTFAVFVYIMNRLSRRRWRFAGKLGHDIGATYGVGLLFVVIGLAMAATNSGDAILWYNGRHQGFFNNPNQLAMIAALTFTLGIGYAAYRKSWIVWLTLAAPLAAIAFSGSRTSLVAAGIAVLWIIVRGSFHRILWASILGTASILIALLMSADPFSATVERFSENEGGDVLNQRTDIWDHVFVTLETHGMGIGWAATPTFLEAESSVGLNPTVLNSAHNSYVQMLFELGWLAVPLALFFVGLLIAVAFRTPVRGLDVGLTATAVVGSLIHLSESAIFGFGQPYPYMFWIAVVGAVAPLVRPPGELVTKTVIEPPKLTSRLRAEAE